MTTNTRSIDPQRETIEEATDRSFAISEAVALFPSEESLEQAIIGLQESGVDRSRISVLGRLPATAAAGEVRNWVHHLVDLDEAPRGNPGEDEVLPEAKSAIISLPGYGGAMAGLIAVMASGGTLGIALASAIVVGAVGSGGGYLISRILDQTHRDQIASQMEAGGLVLWVTLTGDQDGNDAVVGQLRDLGGSNVHVTHRKGHWGAADIPLAEAQPDPLL
tara:strand:- start:26377 stop:27036 length:660 start_codon:yes stop_codon:yes gene_type:complete